VIVPITLMSLLGTWRLASPPPAAPVAAKIRIVQPSVPQREKWRPENQERIFNDHLDLSQTNPAGERDGMAGITHVVWPEAAMPFLPLEYPVALKAIGNILPPGAQVIAGALRADYAGEGPQRRRTSIYNSLVVLGEGGQLVTQYDKIHLVPGGEYLPLQGVLEAIGLQQLTRMRGGFASGPRPRPLLAIPGLPPVTPLICYEAIFPAAVVQGAARPGLIVNVTNDGWFGNSTGPRQHYHQARVRAVEEGVPLVRSANNGISAAFDAQGRVLGTLGMNVRGTLDFALGGALTPPPYARIGDLPFLAGLCILLAVVAWRRGHGRA
jgi:apolipoprotein N-acyltransferase